MPLWEAIHKRTSCKVIGEQVKGEERLLTLKVHYPEIKGDSMVDSLAALTKGIANPEALLSDPEKVTYVDNEMILKLRKTSQGWRVVLDAEERYSKNIEIEGLRGKIREMTGDEATAEGLKTALALLPSLHEIWPSIDTTEEKHTIENKLKDIEDKTAVIGDSLVRGDMSFELTRVEVRRVKVREFMEGWKQTVDPLTIATFRVTNRSATKVYTPVFDSMFDPAVTMIDEFGNKHRSVKPGAGIRTTEGNRPSEVVPGKSILFTMFTERPKVESANKFTLLLKTREPVKETLHFTFTRENLKK